MGSLGFRRHAVSLGAGLVATAGPDAAPGVGTLGTGLSSSRHRVPVARALHKSSNMHIDRTPLLRRLATCALFTLGLVAGSAQAQFKLRASFEGTSEPGWTISSNNADSGILTAASGIDPAGSGWLRLTSNGNSRASNALYTGGSFPSTDGVVVAFDYVSWGGTGADGIVVFLYDATQNMSNASSGGGMGYCFGSGAYLGVGVDEYGNFAGANNSCTSNNPLRPDSIALRGPTTNNGNVNVAYYSAGTSLDDPAPATTSRPSPHHVRYSLIPKSGGSGYRVSVFLDGMLVVNNADFSYPAPAQLRLGVSGGTGGSTNYHEVRQITASTPADVSVTKTVSASSVLRGHAATYTVVLRNEDINTVDAGNQSPNISAANAPTLTDLFPAEFTGASWTCSASTGSTCPAASGSGNIQVNGGFVLASGGSLTYTITGTVAPTAQCGKTVTNTATTDFPESSAYADSDIVNNTSSASFNVACPQIVVAKTSSGGVGTFAFSGSNGIANQSITTTTVGTTATGTGQTTAASNQSTQLVEAAQTGWTLTGITCTGLGSGGTATPDLANRRVTLDSAATDTTGPVTCTFANRRTAADLSITKSNGVAQVVRGQPFDYSIVVSNAGPDAADGAVVTDPSVSGLSCSAVSCGSASGGAACPSGLTVSGLQTGVAIPTLPANSALTFTLTCTAQ